jgi:hypothetical protein
MHRLAGGELHVLVKKAEIYYRSTYNDAAYR